MYVALRGSVGVVAVTVFVKLAAVKVRLHMIGTGNMWTRITHLQIIRPLGFLTVFSQEMRTARKAASGR